MRLVRFFLALSILSGIASAQIIAPQIPLTGNIGSGGVFPLINGGNLKFTSDANHTMVYPEMSATVIKVTSTVSLTSTRNLVAPLGYYQFTITNATTGGQSIQIIGASGAGVTIPNGSTASVVSDGTKYVQVGSASAGTVTNTAGALTAGNCVIGNGSADIKADPDCSTDGAGNMTLKSATYTGTGPAATISANTVATGIAGMATLGTDASGIAQLNNNNTGPSDICTMLLGCGGPSGLTSIDPVALCNAANAQPLYNALDFNAAAPGCIDGGTNAQGYLSFINGAGTAQTILKQTWVKTTLTSVTAAFKFFTSATSGNVVWEIAAACVADGSTLTTLTTPTFTTAATVTTAAPGTANSVITSGAATVNLPGSCAAGSQIIYKIFRSTADSAAAAANLLSVEYFTAGSI